MRFPATLPPFDASSARPALTFLFQLTRRKEARSVRCAPLTIQVLPEALLSFSDTCSMQSAGHRKTARAALNAALVNHAVTYTGRQERYGLQDMLTGLRWLR